MKQVNATIYKTDGSKEPLLLDKETSLETLQKIVGGLIEVIHIIDELESSRIGKPVGCDLVINEEGRLLDLPINPWSRLVGLNSIWEAEDFRGDIILVNGRLP